MRDKCANSELYQKEVIANKYEAFRLAAERI